MTSEAERPVVLAPLRVEARVLRRGLPGLSVVRTGMGQVRAGRAAATLAECSGAVAVAGFGGGLLPTLRPGDLVVASEIRGTDGTRRACPEAAPMVAALRRRGFTVHFGPVASADRVVTGTERDRLRRATGAIAVDMESAAVAAALDGRPLAVLRAIVDGPGRNLPFEAEQGGGRDHRLGRLAGLWPTLAGGVRARRALAGAAPALSEWVGAAGPRRVLLAGPRSFCAGVDRAIEIVERTLERDGPPVYVRKQIVHNVHVVSDLERRGAVFVESLEEVPEGATVVFSAHGVSPEVRRTAVGRRLLVIDATCPLVTKVHAEARRFAKAGYRVYLIGHAGHEEVEGTTGEAPEAIKLVERPEDAALLGADGSNRVAYLTQTTLAVDDVNEVVEALRGRFPGLAGPGSDDICYATQNRQDAVKALARECDLMVVIGSGNSSNSKRLVEVAEREGCPARLIDDETDLDPAWLGGTNTIGVTAGASAPDTLVDRVLACLAGLGPVQVEERTVVEESMRFTLPVELR